MPSLLGRGAAARTLYTPMLSMQAWKVRGLPFTVKSWRQHPPWSSAHSSFRSLMHLRAPAAQ